MDYLCRRTRRRTQEESRGGTRGETWSEETGFHLLDVRESHRHHLAGRSSSSDMKMNQHRCILAEGIRAFAEDHQEDKADLSRFVEAFRQGWKVYRVIEHKKDTLDTFMEAMNNVLWVSEST